MLLPLAYLLRGIPRENSTLSRLPVVKGGKLPEVLGV
jgi:hypothetical protein